MNPHSADEEAASGSELMQRMAEGDRQALADLYDQLSKPLFSTARHILSDASEAEDVVHDVFLTLWENASDFNASKGSVYSWAAALTRNRSIDRLRMRSNRSRLLGQSIPDDLGYAEASGLEGADHHADITERASAVRAALEGLPDEQRRTLELAYFSGLTQKEISETLKEPIGTIKARIRRGLLKLRDSLAQRL